MRAGLNGTDSTLARAHALRRLLIQGIEGLRPGEGFGISDEWRYFNALYFPYVLGFSPYQHLPPGEPLPPGADAVLGWLRVQVPQRTLHNWQNRGAALVATALREWEANGHCR
ncbi:MAG: hypothetical protein HC915_07755 [Anaerolineae bacterium]|nr:hypothetical protein [Anaerolineae bacterium]